MLISSIYPFDIGKNGDKIIREKVIEVLVDKMEVPSDFAVGIASKILNHWQLEMNICCASPNKANSRKFINKKDFIWAIIAIMVDNGDITTVEETLTKSYDAGMIEEGNRYLKDEKNLYHERFEFLNLVLQDYEQFKKIVPPGRRADKEYLMSSSWGKFIHEFDDIKDELLQEYVTKCYMYKLINKNKTLQNVYKGVNLCL